MPVTLPQLSRREFLKRVALAGAGMAAASGYAGLFGGARDNNTFAFFSDCHVAADAALLHNGVNVADNLAACGRELAAWPAKPAAVFVNGDLAFKTGLPADYATFAKLIEPVRSLAPIHLNLGNHDQRENFWSAFRSDAVRQKAVPQKQCSVLETDWANWFLLDSLAATDAAPGELGAAQVAWLDAELAARKEKPALIVGHHNLQSPGANSALKDSAALVEIFARHPAVKAYVFGHTHDWRVEAHAPACIW